MDYITYIRGKVGHEKIFLDAACIILEDNSGRILLGKRGDTGKWGLPGGISELGESLEETALRELYEETGLIAEVDKLIGIYSKYHVEFSSGDKAQCIVTAFKGHITGGNQVCDGVETLELRYFGKDELPEISHKQHYDIIQDYFSGKTGVYR